MPDDSTIEFAERIRQRFPEGLTGVYAPGGTRTAYLTDQKREADKPGHIDDFIKYAEYGLDRLFEQIGDFFDLGGQNFIVNVYSHHSLYERGDDYAKKSAGICTQIIADSYLEFYHKYDADPYMAGIDTLLHLPQDHFAHQMALELDRFQKAWAYKEGRRKVIWEVAPIPLYLMWRAPQVMGEQASAELDAALQSTTDLRIVHDLMYKYYSKALYGTDIPVPHFYLGTNRNGDLKLRALLPFSLLAGGPFRLYYTPYPSFAMTRESLQTLLEDLAWGKGLRSSKTDYSGLVTAELLQAEYDRVQALAADPTSIVGLVRHAGS
jgi:hypothetical protein